MKARGVSPFRTLRKQTWIICIYEIIHSRTVVLLLFHLPTFGCEPRRAPGMVGFTLISHLRNDKKQEYTPVKTNNNQRQLLLIQHEWCCFGSQLNNFWRIVNRTAVLMTMSSKYLRCKTPHFPFQKYWNANSPLSAMSREETDVAPLEGGHVPSPKGVHWDWY